MTIRTPENYGTWWDESAGKAYSQLPGQPTTGEPDTVAIEEDEVHVSSVTFNDRTTGTSTPYASSWTACQVAVCTNDPDLYTEVEDVTVESGEFTSTLWTNTTGETGEVRVWFPGTSNDKVVKCREIYLYINNIESRGDFRWTFGGSSYVNNGLSEGVVGRVMDGDFLTLYGTDDDSLPYTVDTVAIAFRPDTYPLP